MVTLVAYAAVAAAVVVAGLLAARLRPVPVRLVACSDGKIREIAEDDPRISGRI